MRDDGDTFIAASDADDTGITLYLRFKTTTPVAGTYNEEETNRCFNYENDGTIYYDNSNLDDFTFTITEYGNVGGVIKGTFEGDVQNPGAYGITNGFFEVKRKPDNTVSSDG
ncbi:MAG: hypothetical protein CVV44_10570 [Spirochaetae bacterium HGW-Spirochaetae-1]|nr:MAG: hypothetical protein CVV44_10570 [Spirochaetae bacterium HGW-Spirochaetae-1]